MRIVVVTVPYSGDVSRWGTALGPAALLDAGLVAELREAGHDVVAVRGVELRREERRRDVVGNIATLAARTAEAVRAAVVEDDALALVLAGDCTHAVGPPGGLAQAGLTPGIVWFDAHGDINTMATTDTGLLGGMPLAVSMGWEFDDWAEAAGLVPPVDPRAVALVGTCDLDPAERDAIAAHDIVDVDARLLDSATGLDELRRRLAGRAGLADAWYLHVDLDVAGAGVVPGPLTPALAPPSRARVLEAVRAAAETVPVRAATVAVYSPAADADGRGARFGLDVAGALVAGAASAAPVGA
jgi:arginase